jgi:DNA polymerase I - 3''-5'' exonuclease and polymerase domains
LFLRLIKDKVINNTNNINITVIKSIKQLKRIIKSYDKKYISFDIETTGLNRYKDNINLIGFGDDKNQYILDVGTEYSSFKNYPEIQNKMGKATVRLLQNKKTVGSNIKFDNLFLLEKYGIKTNTGFDVMLASHILNENTPSGLKANAVFELGAKPWDINNNVKKGKLLTRKDYDDYVTYLGYDVYWTYKLYKLFKKRLHQDKSLEKVYYHIMLAGAIAYEDIEATGVYIDMDKFNSLEKKLYDKQAGIIKELNKFGEINWSSDKQIREVLYGKLKYPIIETTNTGEPSTGESVLLRLREHGPLPQLILDYRGVTIQITHFIEGWKSRMVDGRLHPSFLMHGTVTGRTSSKNPNLQQTPRDKDIRGMITAPPGWLFVESDYSQLELRVAALVSGERAMTKAFQLGEDIHTKTGRIATGKSELTYEERKKAKSLNFGFLYGMGWRKYKDYARDNYGVTVNDKEAQLFRKRFFEAYSDLPKWHDRQRKIVRAMGQVRNPIGRVRHLPDIYSRDKSKAAEAERQAINSPVQGFGSDMCILSMIEATSYFPKDKARCVGTVHDAILWEVREDYIIEFAEKIKTNNGVSTEVGECI